MQDFHSLFSDENYFKNLKSRIISDLFNNEIKEVQLFRNIYEEITKLIKNSFTIQVFSLLLTKFSLENHSQKKDLKVKLFDLHSNLIVITKRNNIQNYNCIDPKINEFLCEMKIQEICESSIDKIEILFSDNMKKCLSDIKNKIFEFKIHKPFEICTQTLEEVVNKLFINMVKIKEKMEIDNEIQKNEYIIFNKKIQERDFKLINDYVDIFLNIKKEIILINKYLNIVSELKIHQINSNNESAIKFEESFPCQNKTFSLISNGESPYKIQTKKNSENSPETINYQNFPKLSSCPVFDEIQPFKIEKSLSKEPEENHQYKSILKIHSETLIDENVFKKQNNVCEICKIF